MIRGFLRRAVRAEAPLLATSLQRYAEAEAMTWEELARSLGCSPDALDQVALCRPPREENFVADAEAIAGEYLDPARLLPFLRQLQVLGTLAGAPAQASIPSAAAASPPLFLAARVYEEEETYAAEVDAEAAPEEAEEKPEGEDTESRGGTEDPGGDRHA
jgi:hypothetical protein